jgi:hypothetical protein
MSFSPTTLCSSWIAIADSAPVLAMDQSGISVLRRGIDVPIATSERKRGGREREKCREGEREGGREKQREREREEEREGGREGG